ncbi:MAG: hypothetical protein JKY95_03840 [Planctomycetaceae bacterium]|nr:hypothetical protein [Planctomycetaceae bacterium]
MSKLLAVSWTPELLRYVYADAEKDGSLRVINAGEKRISVEDKNKAEAESQDSDEETESAPSIADLLKSLVSELQAGKATLLLCVSRGAIDSVTFNVPPANEAELPTLVRNMAIRQLPGIGEESLLDFIAYPPEADGSRKVSAMVLPAEQQQTVQKLVATANCPSSRILITPHPLRIFAPSQSEENQSSTLVISEGADAAHLLITQHQLPLLSRTVRLSASMDASQRTQFIASEVQRTLLTEEVELGSAVLVGSEVETAQLLKSLQDQFSLEVQQVSSDSLIDGDAKGAAFGVFTPLVAALKAEAIESAPVIDFANPKRPPVPVNMRNRILSIAAVAVLVVVAGWYYVNTQFATIQDEITALKSRRNELNDLVKKTSKKRNLAKVLDRWESSRMSWLDELRDITIRIPSSPELSLQQFSVSPTQKGAVVSFRGTSKSPEAIRKMEINLTDKYHKLKTPGIRERKVGKKSIWTFQTTMNLRSRPRDAYTSHLTAEQIAAKASSKTEKTSSSKKTTSSEDEVKKKSTGVKK